MNETRALLDSLMGPYRNGDTRRTIRTFSDPEVCKNFLCGLCPHTLFTNTVSDLELLRFLV